MTEPDETGSTAEVWMLTLPSSPVRVFPSCAQETEMRGMLKIVTLTYNVKFPPPITLQMAVWLLAISGIGGAILKDIRRGIKTMYYTLLVQKN